MMGSAGHALQHLGGEACHYLYLFLSRLCPTLSWWNPVQALVNPPSTVVDGCSSENDVPVPLGMDHVSDLEDVLLDNLLGPTSIPATDGTGKGLACV